MSSTTYEQLVAILGQIHDTPVDELAPDLSYADLGIDSLTFVELSLRVKRDLGVTVEDDELSEDLTLADTASLIDAKHVPGVDKAS
ncbi:acyl carrier protein [Saccharopolyspora shandongensis]|uniref:Acyl carrier protein n=1 Tax=Saccharopolyspora shandongensis TaxID=418495 RepID=A0A1H2USU1_9PSEU|nr:acyl carrier protein [Saccharopolyspora shandongensis]SDW59038.1 acyl carrier protein [Saccharopolyspora shandongensis]